MLPDDWIRPVSYTHLDVYKRQAYIEADSLVLLQTAQEQAKTVNRTSNGVTVDGDFPWYIQFQVQLNNDKSDSSVPVSYTHLDVYKRQILQRPEKYLWTEHGWIS